MPLENELYKNSIKIYDKINTTTIAIEEYIISKRHIDGNVKTYDLCLFAYFFEEKQDDIQNKLIIRLIAFGLDRGGPSDWKRYEITVTISKDKEEAEVADVSFVGLGDKEGQKEIKAGIIVKMEKSLEGLHTHLFEFESNGVFAGGFKKWRRAFDENRSTYLINGIYESALFFGNSMIASNNSKVENLIIDAATRNASIKVDVIKDNIAKNKIDEGKQKDDAKYTYEKKEPSTLNTPGIVKKLLDEMVIPKPPETKYQITTTDNPPVKKEVTETTNIHNIELDGAFRISYSSTKTEKIIP